MRKFLCSLRFGCAGIAYTAKTEVNMRRHLLAAIAVIGCGIGFQITLVEWAIVIGCVGAMLALECANTSIERLADRVSQDNDPLIGHAKDAAAGAVLSMSLASATIGALVFLPKVLAFIQR